MRATPELPDWIRHARVAGYENAHQLCPNTRHLFGTETLYGDWDGQVLLLANSILGGLLPFGLAASLPGRACVWDAVARPINPGGQPP